MPGAGQNDKTEVDTTIFNQLDAASDGLGRTEGQGKNTVDMMSDAVAQSGSTVPQVSQGGNLTGTLHIVTTDGAGPYTAIVDPTGTGAFATGTKAEVSQQVPGTFGEILPNGDTLKTRRWSSSSSRILRRPGLMKRAANVNKDYVSLIVSFPTMLEYQWLIIFNSLLPSRSQLAQPALAAWPACRTSASSRWRTPTLPDHSVVFSLCKWLAPAAILLRQRRPRQGPPLRQPLARKAASSRHKC